MPAERPIERLAREHRRPRRETRLEPRGPLCVGLVASLAVLTGGCAVRVDLHGMHDAATEDRAPDAVAPMDATLDRAESGDGPADAVDALDATDATDATDGADVADAADTAPDPLADLPRFTGRSGSKGVSVLAGDEALEEYAIYWTVPETVSASPRVRVRVQHGATMWCQEDWTLGDAATGPDSPLLIDGHPANAGSEVAIVVMNRMLGSREIWVRDHVPPSAAATDRCLTQVAHWTVLPAPTGEHRIDSGPTAVDVFTKDDPGERSDTSSPETGTAAAAIASSSTAA